jgi:fucose 4-O-acetylase-like acetyltransferase
MQGIGFYSLYGTITLFYGISSFISNNVKYNSKTKFIILGFSFLVCFTLLGILGFILGFSFLSIKLTLYYAPFYAVGFIINKIQERIKFWNEYEDLSQIFIAVCLIIWFIIITRINVFLLSDSGVSVLVRALTSLLGSIALVGIVSKVSIDSRLPKLLIYSGKYSLEIYLVHHFVLNILTLLEKPEFNSFLGISLTISNFLLTLFFVRFTISLLNQNYFLKLFLFGKVDKI